MAISILAFLAIGWGLFFFVALPSKPTMGNDAVFDFGLAVTAFALGARHAFDVDHIAAIDNLTRKLTAEGQRPVSVGFWFALGHSTVVVVAVALLAAGLSGLASQITNDNSILATVTEVWGPLISGVFLIFIGLLNLGSALGLIRASRTIKQGQHEGAEFERLLEPRGFLYRVLGPLARQVDRPWKMYPIGLLFGLGFDTATTIALFVIGGTSAIVAPWYVVVILPVLFTAGMTLFDTLDGVLMNRAYEWAHTRPLRKVYYNLTITLMSVVVAIMVGGIGLVGLIVRAAHAQTGPLAWIASLEIEHFGFITVGAFLAVWLGAVLWWKARGAEPPGVPRRV